MHATLCLPGVVPNPTALASLALTLFHPDAPSCGNAVYAVCACTLHSGDPVFAWCGPQPNSRLLVNYGIVDESNPYDKMQVQVSRHPYHMGFRVKGVGQP